MRPATRPRHVPRSAAPSRSCSAGGSEGRCAFRSRPGRNELQHDEAHPRRFLIAAILARCGAEEGCVGTGGRVAASPGDSRAAPRRCRRGTLPGALRDAGRRSDGGSHALSDRLGRRRWKGLTFELRLRQASGVVPCPTIRCSVASSSRSRVESENVTIEGSRSDSSP